VDEHHLVPSSNPCNFTMRYESAIVFGKVRFVSDPEKKLRILKMMIGKYDSEKIAKSLEMEPNGVEIGEIIIERITGKKNE
jgi:nitroimidazol reductase NimA-like FMN-containing flavoprotein (pyridoxamine 5'-phosphate oxidase superfamily)